MCSPNLGNVTTHVTETLIRVINNSLGAVMSLNQKVDFQNEVQDSNYREINPNSLFKWNSNFLSSFDGNRVFLAIRCNQERAHGGMTRMEGVRW
jgi:hypothetical protein